MDAFEEVQNHLFLVIGCFAFKDPGIVFGRISLMEEQRGVSSVVDNEVRAFTVGET